MYINSQVYKSFSTSKEAETWEEIYDFLCMGV